MTLQRFRIAHYPAVLFLVLCTSFFAVQHVQAAEFVVPAGDTAALIAAVNAANDQAANPGPNTIVLAAGSTYSFGEPESAGNPHNALPIINSDITIIGNGATLLRDEDGPEFRFFRVTSLGMLTLEGLTLSGGRMTAEAGGGALWVEGGLARVYNSTLANNQTTGFGGGIYVSGGGLLLQDSGLSGNQAASGGAVYIGASAGDDSALIRSGLNENTATASGGGLFSARPLDVQNSVFAGNTAVNGGGLYLSGSLPSTLYGLSITGSTATAGGAVYIVGPGTPAPPAQPHLLVFSTLSGNDASTGGAVQVVGTGFLQVGGSTIHNNRALAGGGGGFMVLDGGVVHVRDSALLSNSASGDGGGGHASGTASRTSRLWLANSTVHGNTAASGGGFFAGTSGQVQVYSSTITNNSTSGFGGGVRNTAFGSISLRHTILFNNATASTLSRDCTGTISSQGYNIVGTTQGCSIAASTGDQMNTNPGLLGLANNGGPTSTRALTAASPARNAGAASCNDWDGALTTDQRAYNRVGLCDIGAYEGDAVSATLPDAEDDSYETDFQTLLNVSAGAGVLANDSHSRPLYALIDTAPAHGLVLLYADGSLVYWPAAGFGGVDQFTYRACDATGYCAQALVQITVKAGDDGSVAAAPNPLAPGTTLQITVQDADENADPAVIETLIVTVINLNTGQEETVIVSETGPDTGIFTGSLATVENAAAGPDNSGLMHVVTGHVLEVQYLDTFDAEGGETLRTVTVNVVQPNRPPVAVDNAYSLPESGTLNAAAPGLLANDSDPDGDPLSVQTTPAQAPQHGTLLLQSSGAFTYTHTGTNPGTDSFRYTVCDNKGACSGAEVVLTITDVPSSISVVRTASTATVNEPGADVVFTTVVSNTSAVDTVTIDSILDSAGGALTDVHCDRPLPADLVPGEGMTCALTRFVGGPPGTVDSSTSSASGVDDDGAAVSGSSAAVEVTVLAVNRPPLAVDDAYELVVGGTLNAAAPGLLANDSDPDGDPLSVQTTPAQAPQHGTLLLQSSGAFTYTHTGTNPGTDSFRYTVCDNKGACSGAEVVLTITDVPSSISVVRTASTATVNEPGADVVFTTVVSNTSAVDTVTIDSILDSAGGALTDVHCDRPLPADLVPGEGMTCALTRFVGGPPGTVDSSTSSASGVDDDGAAVSGSSAAVEVTVADLPSSISVVRTASTATVNEPGADVVFTTVVSNTSAVDTVTIDSILDSAGGALTDVHCDRPLPADLVPGEGMTCALTRFVGGPPGTVDSSTSSASGVDDDGAAVSGSSAAVEVTVQAVSVGSGSITVVKVAQPAGEESFSFSGLGAPFVLDNNPDSANPASRSFGVLTPGSYTITETTGSSYRLDNVSCSYAGGGAVPGLVVDLEGGSVTLVLAAGDDITCTFTNVATPDPLCVPDPRRDLRSSPIQRVWGTARDWTSTVTNSSAHCSYVVGMASYEKKDEILANQRYYSSIPPQAAFNGDGTTVVGPGQSLTLRITVPACSTQIDVFFDASYLGVYREYNQSDADLPPLVLPRFHSGLFGPLGERYGPRLLDALHINGRNYCVIEPPQEPPPDEGEGEEQLPDESGDEAPPDEDHSDEAPHEGENPPPDEGGEGAPHEGGGDEAPPDETESDEAPHEGENPPPDEGGEGAPHKGGGGEAPPDETEGDEAPHEGENPPPDEGG